MPELRLRHPDLVNIQVILSATVDPDPDELVPRAVLHAISQLIPCDVMGIGRSDSTGLLLAHRDLPGDAYDDLSPQVCDGPLGTGLQQQSRLPADDADVTFASAYGITDCLRLGFETDDGCVTQLYLDRTRTVFTDRDTSLLTMMAPVLGRLIRNHAVRGSAADLTVAETRVLELVAAGGSNRDIAGCLFVSVGTVRKHLEHVYRKLGVTNRTAAVAVLEHRTLVH